MALTFTKNSRLNQNTILGASARGARIEYGTVAFDSQYATGGESVSLPGFKEIVYLAAGPKAGYVFEFDQENSKLKVLEVSGATSDVLVQVASSSDLSALTSVPYLAIGY